MQVGYTLHTYLDILFENGNCVATRQRALCVQTLNIWTEIFHYIYRQIQTNSSNKIKFADIPIYILYYNRNFIKILLKGKLMLIYSVIQKDGLKFLRLYFKITTSDKYDVN